MVHADGSISQTWDYLKQHGLQGFIDIWPRPTATAWKIIGCYAAFEAALQLLLPGKRVEGPVSPAGNRPVYKVLNTEFCTFHTDLSISPHQHFCAKTNCFQFYIVHGAGKWCGGICCDIGYISGSLVVRLSHLIKYMILPIWF